MSIVYSSRSLRDLEDIHAFIAERSPAGAAAVMRRIESTIDLIARCPGAGRTLRRRRGVRLLPVGRYPYRIYYSADGDNAVILHIRHTSRRSPKSSDLQ